MYRCQEIIVLKEDRNTGAILDYKKLNEIPGEDGGVGKCCACNFSWPHQNYI